MKERPIIFSAPMVRAILTRTKTQTRRIVKVRGGDDGMLIQDRGLGWWPYRSKRGPPAGDDDPYGSPYGQAGDRLWVKETWRPGIVQSEAINTFDGKDVWIEYAAEGERRHFDRRDLPQDWRLPQSARQGKNVSPLFMPRWASRITLEVLGVRVQRLQDCSEADAVAEGVERLAADAGWREYGSRPQDETAGSGSVATARASYKSLWESIHGAGSWDRNPWVWAVEFRRNEN